MLKDILQRVDPILLIGIIASVFIGIVMVLSGNDTLSSLTIGLLGTIITLLVDVVARIQKSEGLLSEESERIISSLKGVDISLFERREDVYSYLERKLKQAKRYVDVTHSSPSTQDTYSSSKQYYDTFSRVIKSNKIKVRRIIYINSQEQLNWVRQMLAEFSDCSLYIGCYPKLSHFAPTMSLFIVDGEEVIITGGERSPSYNVKTASIKHPFFVKVAQEHFDALWRNSMRVNEKEIRTDFLEQLEKFL